MSHFLRVSDRSGEELRALVERAVSLRARVESRSVEPALAGTRIAMWWDGEGFRNRVAFELGAAMLGAHVVQVPGAVGHREPVGDVGQYLGNWCDALVVRTPSLAALGELADATSAMVVNARTSDNHPCEILGDLAFIHGATRSVGEPLHVVFVGAATNLCHSWMEAASVLPLTVTQVCPDGYAADVRHWRRTAGAAAGSVSVSGDMRVVSEADVVYTDCWPTDLDAESRHAFERLRISAATLSQCRPETVFLPCPPVTRGEEVSPDAMADPRCRVVEAKSWLLEAQSALLLDGLGCVPST